MDSKTLFLAVVMMYIVDVGNALMCYNCTMDPMSQNPVCGQTLGDNNDIQQIACSGSCMLGKSTMPMMGTVFTMYIRECREYCVETCVDSPDVEGGSSCMKCCKTDLCNSDWQDATAPPVKDTTTPSSAINVVVNFATVFFTGLLSATLF